jgi:hypothetical protein
MYQVPYAVVQRAELVDVGVICGAAKTMGRMQSIERRILRVGMRMDRRRMC